MRDLPNLDEFAPDDATRQLIRERLSAGGQEARVAPEAQMSDGEAVDPLDGLQFDFEDEGADGALTSEKGSRGVGAGGENRSSLQAAPERAAAGGQLPLSADDPDRDASGSHAAFPAGDGPASNAAQQMLADAMAQSFGLVEKIDFDNLKFETDDE